jgi:hypothetical protein
MFDRRRARHDGPAFGAEDRALPFGLMADGDLAACRRMFADFGRQLQGSAPLYATLADGISRDEALSSLLLVAPRSQRQPVLVFACVHWLLLNDSNDPLGEWYPNISIGEPRRGGEIDAFARFCSDHDAELRGLLATRSTQTNEIGRSSLFLPGFALLDDTDGPLARIDVGASAGLNLLSSEYRFDYRPGGVVGADSTVVLACSTRGAVPVPDAHPTFGASVGLDAHPIDVSDVDQARWLEACVWPDEVERFRRLHASIEIARSTGVDVRQGDAIRGVGPLIDEVAPHGHPVVTTSWVMNYLSPEDRLAFVSVLDVVGERRNLSWIYAENPGLCPELPGAPAGRDAPNLPTALVIVRWRNGRRNADHVGQCHPHGRWLHWVR